MGSASTFLNQASQYPTPSNPYEAAKQTTAGNIYGAQSATAANRVNQLTPYGSLNYSQTGTDAYGNPIYSATQSLAPQFQNAFGNLAQGVTQSTQGQFNPNLPSTGINPGETYSSAIMRRLEPQMQMQQKQFDAQMANQGIVPGTEAYTNARRSFDQQQNDLLTSAQVQGMQTGLAANQQAYNQALTNYQLPMSQLAAFKTATAPSYVNPYQQASVAGPDISGAYSTQQAVNLAQQTADAQRQAILTQGLFNLGAGALSSPKSVSDILSGISSGYKTVKSWLPSID